MKSWLSRCAFAAVVGLMLGGLMAGGCGQKEGTVTPSGEHLDDPRERMGLRRPGGAASNAAAAPAANTAPAPASK